MGVLWILAVSGVLAFAAQPPVSGGCLQTLPVDGTWARYQVSLKQGQREISAQWTARSVGQITHNGIACRWIELEQTSDEEMFEKMTWRCLVPESEFGEGKHPLGKAIKVWRIIQGKDAESVESFEARDELFAALIQGPAKDLSQEETPEIVRWQRGNLECSVVVGNSQVKVNEFLTFQIRHRLFRHAEAPFQMGGVHWVLTVDGGDENSTVDAKMILQDTGTGAQAQYPDLGG